MIDEQQNIQQQSMLLNDNSYRDQQGTKPKQ